MENVVIFGGAGFIGRPLVKLLVEAGYHVIIPTRNRERVKRDLIVLPNTDVVESDTSEPRSIAKLAARADIVINLVGILHEHRSQTFEKVNVEYMRKLTDVVAQADTVKQFIHVSSLNAATGAPSRYLRSKGKGESFVSSHGRLNWTIIRPSGVFGPGDLFLNLFVKLMKLTPVFMIPMPEARLQPIWVNDLAEMIVATIHNPACFKKTLVAVGPEILRLDEIVKGLAAGRGMKRVFIPCGRTMSKMMATVVENVPFMEPLFTRDDVDTLSIPSISESANHAQELVKGKLFSVREYLAMSQAEISRLDSYSEHRQKARHK